MKIGNFNLNTDGTYIIAELSANHNGHLQNALVASNFKHILQIP